MFEGDLEEGELEIGQIASTLGAMQPAAQIVQDMVAEFEQLKRAIAASSSRFAMG
jgi:enoyl-[acyl-carrier protein] reductase II